jgi:hypothetical protein
MNNARYEPGNILPINREAMRLFAEPPGFSPLTERQ